MIAVVCFTWNTGFREYLPEYVNILAASVRRNLSLPHRFICITDETEGFSDAVTVMPLPQEARPLVKLKNPCGARFPSSYRRMWLFSEAAKELGSRILLLDVDCVITRSLDPLFEPDEDFIGWRPNYNWGNGHRIGGGTWLLKTGTRTDVWERISKDPIGLIAEAKAAGFNGSDQAAMSYLMQDCKVWPKGAGIYQSQDIRSHGFKKLPADARIVHFNGGKKAWGMKNIPWIKENWRA